MATEPTAGTPQDSGPPPDPKAGAERARLLGFAPFAPAVRPTALSTPPNALALLKALRRRWAMAAGFGLLLAAVLGAGTWFLLPPPKHYARTLVHLPLPRPFVPGFAVQGPNNLYDHQRNQVALVRSRLVLNAALRDPEVARLSSVLAQPDPVEWLEGQVQADFAHAPEILKIGMYGEKPEELAVLVNAVREAFLKEVVERDNTQRRQKQGFLAALREKHEGRLKDGKKIQKGLEAAGAPKDVVARALALSYFQQQLGRVDSESNALDSDLRKANLELREEQEREASLNEARVPAPLLDAAVNGSDEVRKLDLLVQAYQQQIDKNLAIATQGENEPVVQSLRADQQKVKSELAALKKKLRPEVEKAMREKAAADLSANIARLQRSIKLLTANKKALTEEQERRRADIQKKMQSGADLDDVREDLSLIEELIKKITAQEFALSLELETPKAEQILEPAVIYYARSKSRQVSMALGAAGAGLALAVLAVSFWEFRARRVDTVDEVSLGLGLTIIGSLPDSSHRPRRLWSRGLSTEAYGHALLTESIDATRTMLLHASRQGAVQVLMVTSAAPGEGKTSLASHLAASLARSGLKTLLIDGDLRNPTAHRLFELPNGAGLSDVLRGEALAAEVIQPTAVSGLWFLAAGQWDGLAAQGLALNRTRTVLGHLRRDYDFIVVDSSPVLPVTDALLLGQSVDAAVLSVLRDVSRLPNVHTAGQRLAAVGVPILGAVVNGVSGDLYSTTYQYVEGTKTTPETTPEESST